MRKDLDKIKTFFEQNQSFEKIDVWMDSKKVEKWQESKKSITDYIGS